MAVSDKKSKPAAAPARPPSPPSWELRVASLVVKAVAIAGGFAGGLVGLMALVGSFTESGWVRAPVALVVLFGLPLLVADRLIPSDPSRPAGGVVTDVVAIAWSAFVFVFAGLLGGTTGPILGREGDRLARADWPSLASVAYWLGGLRVSAQGDAPAPSGSASAGPVSSDSPSASDAAAPPADAGAPADAAADAAAAPSPKGDKSPAELFQALAPSVVTIFVKGARGQGSGTGFLVDTQGTLATNHHVIDGATNVLVKFKSGARFDTVELLADSPAVDLALLRVDLATPMEGGAPVTGSPLSLGDSEQVVVGERAISIGNPLGLEHTLTDGLVSARRIYDNRPWIQMSVPVSPGNSGGPLFNMRGEVIGITTQVVAPGLGQNLNLAVPINELKRLIQPTYPQRRKFGVGEAPSQW